MATHGASRVHSQPLLDALSVEAVTAGTNTRGARESVLTYGARCVHSDVLFSRRSNLLPCGHHWDGIHKVATQIHWDVDDHTGRGLELVRPKNAQKQGGVAHIGGKNIVPSAAFQKAKRRKKHAFSLEVAVENI
jgi:hypothetical protein